MFVFDHVEITTPCRSRAKTGLNRAVCGTSPTRQCLSLSERTPLSHSGSRRSHLIFNQEVLIPPFVVGDFLEVVFVRKHNTIFEYIHYLKEGWFGN
jgi:hypothetical protein